MLSTMIIDGCKRKERLAFKQCYEACSPYVYAVVKNYLYDNQYREDAMQEIFAEIFSNINRYDPAKGKFKSWIAQIAVYQCINILKKRKNLSLVVSIDDQIKETKAEELNLLETPKIELEKWIEGMPAGYRTVFLLNAVDGYSHKEISEILGINITTSRSQYIRALKWLRKNKTADSKFITYG